ANLTILVISCPLFGGNEYFVSTDGSDTNPGTQAQPFATLQRARDAVRDLKESSNLPKAGVTVWIEAGTYYVNEPLMLSAEDSGSENAPIVYRANTGAEVRIVGGRQVKGFKPVTNPEILKRLDESVRQKVVCADLKAAGISDYGQVAARENRLELFFRDEPMQLARWPNEGFLQIVDVAGETSKTIHGRKGTVEGKIVYSDDRPKRWADENEIWLHGYWFWDWSDSFEKVSSIDTAKRTIETAPPYHGYGYRKGQRYYALNILAELDRPGEWYLDRQNGILYFLPPTPVDEGKTVLSMLRHLFVLKDCSWVTIRDLVLEATRSTAVTISGGTSNTIAGCTIRNTGSWAVRISGGSNNSVVGCDIYRTAEGGVSMSGGDRKTLRPAGHRAENNHIHHFGRIYRTYRPAVAVSGVGNHVAHNVIHDGPHNAIQLGGNDHIIEFNEIYNVCFETGDVGAFYMGRDWTARGTIIRHNYFHHIKGPGLHGAMAVYLDDSASGISIIGNIFHRAGRAAFIGGGRDNLVENNIFVDCPASVHVDARGVGWMKYHVEPGGTLPERLKAVPYRQPPWSEKYPSLVNILDDSPGEPRGNIVRRNISFGGKWLDVENKAMPLIKFEDNLVDKDPHFVDLDRQDFRLRPDSPAFALGFQQIPIEKIGLYFDEYRTNKNVTGTFSIVAADPETGVCGAAV
ncbi:MAG: right-handed parallel beta-helix repeat-containing protein, partial [Planctomycetota bacterium]